MTSVAFWLVLLVTAAAAATDSARYELESKLTELYDVCSADETCAMRFYLRPQHTTGNNGVSQALDAASMSVERQKFFRLVVAWAQNDACPLRRNSLRGRITLNDYQSADAAWWLTAMNTAKLCPDNQVWELGRGCVINAERLGQSDAVHTHAKLDSAGQPIVAVTIAVSCITIIGAIVGAVFAIRKSRDDVIKKLDKLEHALQGQTTLDTHTRRLIGATVVDDDDEDDDDDEGVQMATELGVRSGTFGFK